MNEVIDIEPTEVTVASLVSVTTHGSLVTPAAPMSEIEEAFTAYSQLCARLLDASDHQRIGDKDFRKKSAWRKLAVAFGVSCELAERDYERDQRGRIIRAEVVVRATAPNGRHMDGLGACDLFEKCCLPGCRKRHQHCTADCDGRRHFSNPQHDLPATAMTRATNRACADLFGMGEVSAEEIVGDAPVDEEPAQAACPKCGELVQGARSDKEPMRAHMVTEHDYVRNDDGTVAPRKVVPATSTGLPAQDAGGGSEVAPRTEAPDPSPATIADSVRDRLLARMDALPDETRRAVEDACVTACDGRFPNELTASDVPTVSELIEDGAASVKPGAALAARAAKHANAGAA